MSLKDKAPIRQHNDGKLQKYDLVEIDQIIPYANNAKKHPKWQINQIKDSIEQFGFITPIVTDENFQIITGHGRYEAVKLMGFKKIPVILVDHLSKERSKAYRIADNQIGMNTEHDSDILRVELQSLAAEDLDFGLESQAYRQGNLTLSLVVMHQRKMIMPMIFLMLRKSRLHDWVTYGT